MTDLRRPVKRRSAASVRDRGKQRRIVVTLYPAGFIGMRLEGTRRDREETLTIEAAYQLAIMGRLERTRAARRNKR